MFKLVKGNAIIVKPR